MLSLLLSLALLPQAPQASSAWITASSAPRGGGTVSIEGTVELTRGEAHSSALRLARENHRSRVLAVGSDVTRRVLPAWLPQFFVRDELNEWTQRLMRAAPLEVVHDETVVRRYSYGEAFQTTLHCAAEIPSAGGVDEAWLEREVRDAGRLLLAKCGGIAVYWGLLAFLSSWFDRLTRGYMTWRLRTISLGLGVAVPAVLLLV